MGRVWLREATSVFETFVALLRSMPGPTLGDNLTISGGTRPSK